MGGPRGYDGGKKVNGRKRHLVVDTQGLLLAVKVLPADLHDRPAAEPVLAGLRQRFPGVRLLWADTAYRGLADWLAGNLGWSLEITRHWWTGAPGVGARAAAAGTPGRVPGAAAPLGGRSSLCANDKTGRARSPRWWVARSGSRRRRR